MSTRTQGRRRAVRALGAAAVAAGALTLTGCVGISAILAPDQPVATGPVTLSIVICATGAPDCLTTSNNDDQSAYEDVGGASVQSQLLYAIRLPVGATPATPSATGLSWLPSPSYESELQALEPAPAGQRWWGWITAPFTYTQAGPQARRIDVAVVLPRPASGAPFPSPLPWRAVVGGRIAESDLLPTLTPGRPVECGATNADLYADLPEEGLVKSIICVDSPNPATTRTDTPAAVTDYGLTGTDAQAPAGTTGRVTFTLARSGAAAAGDGFAIAVEGGPPGATLTPLTTSVPLGAAETPVAVDVAIPANVTLGDYPITVTATAPGLAPRAATATLRVVAAPPQAPPAPPPPADPSPTPTPSPGPTPTPTPTPADTTAPRIQAVRLSQATFRRTTTRAVTLAVRSTEAGRVTVAIQRLRPGRRVGAVCRVGARTGRTCVVIARVRSLARASTGTAALRLAGGGVRRLAPGRYRAEIRVTDGAGNRSAVRRVIFTVRP